MSASDLMNKIVSLCKRRGFVFQSSEIYGGLKSCYDYGPLGVELKRNIAQAWWNEMVVARENIVGIDASIIMHPKVWEASGHLAGFSDPLVDCLNCKERFRADKAPKQAVGSTVEYVEGGKKGGKKLSATATRGYVCPQCSSPLLSEERQFHLMFKTTLGPIEPVYEFIKANYKKGLPEEEFFSKLAETVKENSVYLRPETAQAMFVQFNNVQQTMSMKVPFGIAQIGKSFRNEIITEHFIFRSCEFEQMEMEFFVEPGTQKEWMEYWKKERLNWYKNLSRSPDNFRLRQHAKDELAHYSDDCYDVEYLYPWGWDELEGIASRTDYDLKKHSQHANTKLSYFDPNATDPATGKTGYRYTPYVIEPAAGLTRSVLALLLDSYEEQTSTDANGESKTRVLLRLNPRIAPIKLAALPLVKDESLEKMAQDLVNDMRQRGYASSLDTAGSIGKRYAKHDEIGTPFAVTFDRDSQQDNSATIRLRDTAEQIRKPIAAIADFVSQQIKQGSKN
ncbi:MAG: glycine--tRNA ligase [Oligoflexales bacterium]